MQAIKVGIIGGTGYTGVELLRILSQHPQVEVVAISSRSEAGRHITDFFPSLRGLYDLEFSDPKEIKWQTCDVVFFATPNGVAMHEARQLFDNGIKIIDLSADFRLKDEAEWSHWYGMDHACPELIEQAVYGLPELHREAISRAKIVANPGCYPTPAQLGLFPLLKQNLIETHHIIIDAKSGVSGAGRKSDVNFSLCEVNESFKAYAAGGHRHLPEIRQGLNAISEEDVNLTFVPHLVPMIRGMHNTMYAPLNSNGLLMSEQQLHDVFSQQYENEDFVDVLPLGVHPETRSVKAANTCRISLFRPQAGHTIVVLAVIDNLVKGAAGQAVQNMNIMFGVDEKVGIASAPVCP